MFFEIHWVIFEGFFIKVIGINGTTTSLPHATESPFFSDFSFERANHFFVFVYRECV